MPNCKCCGKPVINGVVLHSECFEAMRDKIADKGPQFIVCRNCPASKCEGCNIFTLATALIDGNLNFLIDETGTVRIYETGVFRAREEADLKGASDEV